MKPCAHFWGEPVALRTEVTNGDRAIAAGVEGYVSGNGFGPEVPAIFDGTFVWVPVEAVRFLWSETR